MKLSQITLAVAATLVAGQAAALTPAQIASARSAGTLVEAWITGATAPTFNVFKGFEKGCVDAAADGAADDLHIYTSDATGTLVGSMGNFTAYACTRASDGKKVVLYHTLDGGSFNAFAPHFPDIDGPGPLGVALKRVSNLDTATGCVAKSSTTTPVYPMYGSCSTTTPAAKPDGGVSDVESALWKDITAGMKASDYGTETGSTVGQVFGLAVSTNLYRALQAAQGLPASCQDAANTDKTADDWNGDCQPSISTQQYTSIAAQSGGYHTDWAPILGAAGVGKPVHLARRVDTSGTQASSNYFFMKNPCNGDGDAGGKLTPASVADSVSGAFIVTENSGTSDVKKAIDKQHGLGQYAIGVISLENDFRKETVADRDDYRFVKLDGVSPEGMGDTTYARKSANEGLYPFASEMVSFVANTASAASAQVINDIVAAMGAPGSCSDVPRGLFLNPLGGSGLGTDCEHKGTKFGANCQPFQLFY